MPPHTSAISQLGKRKRTALTPAKEQPPARRNPQDTHTSHYEDGVSSNDEDTISSDETQPTDAKVVDIVQEGIDETASTNNSDDTDGSDADIQAIFRCAFEKRFAPLPGADNVNTETHPRRGTQHDSARSMYQPAQALDEELQLDDSDASEDEDEAWSGFDSDNDISVDGEGRYLGDQQLVQIVDYASKDGAGADAEAELYGFNPDGRSEAKSFMVCSTHHDQVDRS